MNFIIILFLGTAILNAVTGHLFAALFALLWVGICLYAKRKFAELEQGSDQDKDHA